ncbi:RsiW-degrading membrane proteinase PrsW (M82 family) [Allonocardiopsis opalescens]|uniref:RsiW-degrading membrane proteinase PrsW (M82 family) n=2 Tax=Allonocardiopsis opalescens TaxID=1144618 RepID=A0A2T0PUF5_9ACTN|nr:RsiW-degrading membrane proteinase PrsW (M82 family) [Allonocardiopsis opalescens]
MSGGVLVTLIGSALCLLLFLLYLGVTGLTGAGLLPGFLGAFVFALLLAVVPLPVWGTAVLLLDRLKPQPTKLLLVAFLWGSGVATLASLVMNTVIGMVLVPMFGEGFGDYLGAAVGAPVVEESFKGMVLLGYLWFRRRRIAGVSDGIILGMLVGLGFAWVENILYYLNYGFFLAGGFAPDYMIELFLTRGVMLGLLHPVFTAMIGIGIASAAMNRSGALRVVFCVLGWFGAVALHALWNGSTPFGILNYVAMAVMVLVLVMILVVVAVDRRRVVATISRYLPAYIPTGLVTDTDIAMLSSMGNRRQARRWAQQAGGGRGRRAMGAYQLAAVELASLHRQVEHGVADRDWTVLRDAYLAHMHQARRTFLQHVPQPPTPVWTGGSSLDSGFLRREPWRPMPTGPAPGGPQQPGTGPQQPPWPAGPPSRGQAATQPQPSQNPGWPQQQGGAPGGGWPQNQG